MCIRDSIIYDDGVLRGKKLRETRRTSREIEIKEIHRLNDERVSKMIAEASDREKALKESLRGALEANILLSKALSVEIDKTEDLSTRLAIARCCLLYTSRCV